MMLEIKGLKVLTGGTSSARGFRTIARFCCNSIQSQISLCEINAFSVREVMRITDMIIEHEFRF